MTDDQIRDYLAPWRDLADRILAAPGPGAATMVFVDGCRAMGESEERIRAEVVACDLAAAVQS